MSDMTDKKRERKQNKGGGGEEEKERDKGGVYLYATDSHTPFSNTAPFLLSIYRAYNLRNGPMSATACSVFQHAFSPTYVAQATKHPG